MDIVRRTTFQPKYCTFENCFSSIPIPLKFCYVAFVEPLLSIKCLVYFYYLVTITFQQATTFQIVSFKKTQRNEIN